MLKDVRKNYALAAAEHVSKVVDRFTSIFSINCTHVYVAFLVNNHLLYNENAI